LTASHVLLFGSIGFALLCWLNHVGKREQQAKRIRDVKERMQRLTDETTEFVTRIEQDGALPSLETLNVHLQAGEFAVLHEPCVVLRGFNTQYVAVRRPRTRTVGLGQYPAEWESRPADQMSPLATGDLYLTNKRVLFLGGVRTMSLPWTELLSIKPTLEAATPSLDSITIATNLSQQPFAFAVKNPPLWAVMIGWMSAGQPARPELEKGTRIVLKVEQNFPEGRIYVEIRSDEEADAHSGGGEHAPGGG
jgi:hypothetical protein